MSTLSKSAIESLPGSVHPQWVTCGNPRCKCARGELHGPYWYRFWYEDGKLRKGYVKLQDLLDVWAGCDQYRREQDLIQQTIAEFRRRMQVLAAIDAWIEKAQG
jgi:hypothetical protein